jgi:S-methylmethionine-dependent homocysteine/selenocysteine methylase
MDEQYSPEGDLAGEFRQLAEHLKQALHTAWESEERRQLQNDIHQGLKEVGQALNEAATEFRASPTGQNLESELNDLGERIRSGEVETKARQELLKAVQLVNQELAKFTASMEKSPPPSEE